MRCAPRRHRAAGAFWHHRGASLIEILVAVLILSLGLLGLAGMQVRAQRGNHSSVQRTQAVILGQHLLDLMRVDRQSALQGDYDTPAASAAPAASTASGPPWACTLPAAPASSLAGVESHGWFTEVKSRLGRAGDGTTCVRVDCDPQGLCSVELRWDDSASGGLPDQRLSLHTRL